LVGMVMAIVMMVSSTPKIANGMVEIVVGIMLTQPIALIVNALTLLHKLLQKNIKTLDIDNIFYDTK